MFLAITRASFRRSIFRLLLMVMADRAAAPGRLARRQRGVVVGVHYVGERGRPSGDALKPPVLRAVVTEVVEQFQQFAYRAAFHPDVECSKVTAVRAR